MFMRTSRQLVAALAVSISSVSCLGGDEFPGYAVWAQNQSSLPFSLVLFDGTDLQRIPVSVSVPADGLVRQSGPVVLVGRGDGTDTAFVFVFDQDCHEVGRFDVGAGGYQLLIGTDESAELTRIEPAAALRSAPALPPSDATCRPR